MTDMSYQILYNKAWLGAPWVSLRKFWCDNVHRFKRHPGSTMKIHMHSESPIYYKVATSSLTIAFKTKKNKQKTRFHSNGFTRSRWVNQDDKVKKNIMITYVLPSRVTYDCLRCEPLPLNCNASIQQWIHRWFSTGGRTPGSLAGRLRGPCGSLAGQCQHQIHCYRTASEPQGPRNTPFEVRTCNAKASDRLARRVRIPCRFLLCFQVPVLSRWSRMKKIQKKTCHCHATLR